MPVANARSRTGNHVAIVLMQVGKLPPSPRPSTMRARMKPVTEADHAVRGGRQAPQDRGGGKAEADADLVGEPPHPGIADGIGDREEEDDVAEIGFGEVQIALDRRLEHAEDVAVHVVDGGDDEQQTHR